MTWDVEFSELATKRHVPDLPYPVRDRVKKAIYGKLANDPYTFGKPLQGSLKGLRRLRVGDYRVVFALEPEHQKIRILAIAHRKDIYSALQAKPRS